MKLFTKPKSIAVRFCDRCSGVCDSVCRSEVIRERAQKQVLLSGWRMA